MVDSRNVICGLLAWLVTSFFAPQVLAAEDAAPRPVEVADLAWFSGEWEGEKGGGLIEEFWSTTEGGAMMGMFRWLAEDQVRLYEFLLIEPGPAGPVMRIKHFSPGLKGWEDKEASLEFHLTSYEPGRAVFEMDPEIEPTRLVYEHAGGGTLAVRLIKAKDGQEQVTEFRYSRKP